MAQAIEAIYIVFTGFVGFLLVWNFRESSDVYEEILYAVALIPFVLRVVQLK